MLPPTTLLPSHVISLPFLFTEDLGLLPSSQYPQSLLSSQGFGSIWMNPLAPGTSGTCPLTCWLSNTIFYFLLDTSATCWIMTTPGSCHHQKLPIAKIWHSNIPPIFILSGFPSKTLTMGELGFSLPACRVYSYTERHRSRLTDFILNSNFQNPHGHSALPGTLL